MKLMSWFAAIAFSLSAVASAQTNEVEIKQAIKTVNLNKKSVIYKAKGFKIADFEKAMTKFMVCENLTEEDSSFSVLRWKLIRAVDHGTYTALLVNHAGVNPDGSISELLEDAWEVIAVKNTVAARTASCDDTSFVLFETAFPLPEYIRAGFENQPADVDAKVKRHLWYGEFTDEASKRDILKAVYTGHPFSGLTMGFTQAANGALAWDKTEGRNWSMINAVYDLHKGSMGIEIGDGFSDLFDNGNFEHTAAGCAYHMAPWSSGMVRQIVFGDDSKKGVEVLSVKLAKERIRKNDKPVGGGIGIGIGGGGISF